MIVIAFETITAYTETITAYTFRGWSIITSYFCRGNQIKNIVFNDKMSHLYKCKERLPQIEPEIFVEEVTMFPGKNRLVIKFECLEIN